mmetsp:Transcript_23420/g.50602  ORF Transcript_23420/g.50602 Transcript_23420/m.50602 type:complete len:272 (-) Transcript_23420:2162-2977(-)
MQPIVRKCDGIQRQQCRPSERSRRQRPNGRLLLLLLWSLRRSVLLRSGRIAHPRTASSPRAIRQRSRGIGAVRPGREGRGNLLLVRPSQPAPRPAFRANAPFRRRKRRRTIGRRRGSGRVVSERRRQRGKNAAALRGGARGRTAPLLARGEGGRVSHRREQDRRVFAPASAGGVPPQARAASLVARRRRTGRRDGVRRGGVLRAGCDNRFQIGPQRHGHLRHDKQARGVSCAALAGTSGPAHRRGVLLAHRRRRGRRWNGRNGHVDHVAPP